MSWKLGEGLPAGVTGTALNWGSVEFVSGLNPALTLPTIYGHQLPPL